MNNRRIATGNYKRGKLGQSPEGRKARSMRVRPTFLMAEKVRVGRVKYMLKCFTKKERLEVSWIRMWKALSTKALG